MPFPIDLGLRNRQAELPAVLQYPGFDPQAGGELPPILQGIGQSQPSVPVEQPPAPMSMPITDLAPGVDRGFDYEGAMNLMTEGLPEPKQPKLFGRGGNGWRAIGIIGDAMQAMSGGRPTFAPMLAEERQNRINALRDLVRWRYRDYDRKADADATASTPFTIGRTRLRYNPQTGKNETIYQGDSDAVGYAKDLGFEPGTDQFHKATEDYVLRGHGPTAFDRTKQIDDYRTGNDLRLESARQQGRIGLEDKRQGNRMTLRQTPNYRDTHGAPARQSSPRAPVATDANGNKVKWNGKAWVPSK